MFDYFLIFCFCFCSIQLFSEQKEQFLQVIRHADQLSSPAQMANVSRKHGSVIMTISMIVEMDQMNSSAVSFEFSYLNVFLFW